MNYRRKRPASVELELAAGCAGVWWTDPGLRHRLRNERHAAVLRHLHVRTTDTYTTHSGIL